MDEFEFDDYDYESIDDIAKGEGFYIDDDGNWIPLDDDDDGFWDLCDDDDDFWSWA